MKRIALLGLLTLSFALTGCSRGGGEDRGGLLKRFIPAKAVEGGGLCGDPQLVGEVVGKVDGRISACGIENAVRLESVAGVQLSQAALIECSTARALKTWVTESVQPEFKKPGVTGLRVAAHYACRTRNNQPGAKISEHGRGRAIDISGIQLADGREVTVLDGWNARSTRKSMRRLHGDACGPFGTVLGPNSDRFHKDHFHFDTASYRSGSYCR